MLRFQGSLVLLALMAVSFGGCGAGSSSGGSAAPSKSGTEDAASSDGAATEGAASNDASIDGTQPATTDSGSDSALRDGAANETGTADAGSDSCTSAVGCGSEGDANNANGGDANENVTVGGTVTGLAMGASIVLQNSGGGSYTANANGTFLFTTSLPIGAPYAVTVATQPTSPSQTCTVVNGSGVVEAAVTNIAVNCVTNTFLVGATVTGLATGDSVVLQDNGGDNYTANADGAFLFATPVTSGATYAVTVLTQPTSPSQTCTVTMGTGTVENANVTSVAVNCVTASYTIGGTLMGLGTSESIVLQDNNGDNLTLSTNGAFTFPTSVQSGLPYSATVLTSPSTPPQVCSLSAASGMVTSANITSIVVNCATNTYTVGGTITGLTVGDSFALVENNSNTLFVMGNGSFVFPTPAPSGSLYNVAIQSNPGSPVAETCTVTNGSGMVTTANVTGIMVSCVVNDYAVGGTIAGLATNETLVLTDGTLPNMSVVGNGSASQSFTFPALASGSNYAVAVVTNPSSPAAQQCTVMNGSGQIGYSAVTTVQITCVTVYTIGGAITGLASGDTVVLQDNGVGSLSVTSSGGTTSFTFPTPVPSGGTYMVTVLTNPSFPVESCTITSGGTGNVSTMNVTTVAITCNTSIVYSQSFTQGANSTAQCSAWQTFQSQLTGTYSTITVTGSLGSTYTCTGTAANQICQAIHGNYASSTNDLTVACSGNTWYVGGCSSNGPTAEVSVNQGTCQCGSTASIRPCINNDNWGGLGTTCDATNQTLAVTCQ